MFDEDLREEKYTVSDFLESVNYNLFCSYTDIIIEGEVSNFKVSQNKWVFFDLKDENCSLGCFMTLWNLRVPLEDGMKVIVRCTPKITDWGKFSVTISQIQPVGEGNIKKTFELLKKKLKKEGLFDLERKRSLPKEINTIGVISSTGAAGYADFIKILNERWGGLKVQVVHTQVQGLDAPDQIIRALKYLNEHAEVDVIAILRGGGSADDLAAFNDEQLVRAIASSRIPIITGIGHEVDESLSDLAADVRASTPSNAAQMLTQDRHAQIAKIHSDIDSLKNYIIQCIDSVSLTYTLERDILVKITNKIEEVRRILKTLDSFNPEKVLKRGYAILSGKISPGEIVKITTYNQKINAEVKNVQNIRK